MSLQNINNIKIFTQIQQLYPDIEGQLQNRHCSLYGKIKLKFQKLYQQMVPEYFISAKGIVQIFKVTGTPFALSIAIENGVMIALARTYKDADVYINSNYQQQQIILSNKGDIVQNGSNSSVGEWARIGWQIGLSNSMKNNLYGAIIYLQNNIPRDSFKYEEAHILGFTLACLLINNLTDEFMMQQLEQKISEAVLKKIPSYNSYQNYGLLVTDGYLQNSIKVADSNWKFILCDILLDQSQLKDLNERKKVIQIEQKLLQTIISKSLNKGYQTLMDFKRQSQIQSMEEILKFATQYIHKNQYTLQQSSIILNQQLFFNNPHQKFNPKKRLANATLQYNCIQNLVLNCNKNGFQSAIRTSLQILNQQNLLPQKAVNLINFCLANQALACTIVQNTYLLILIQKNKMLKLFQLIKKKVFIFNNEIETAHQKKIHHLIFSSLPSKGVGIIKPDSSTQLWFQ